MVDEPIITEPVCRSKRHRIFFIVLPVLAIVFALFAVGIGDIKVWSGRFKLTLDVSSLSGTSINEVSYAAFFDLERAKTFESHTNAAADEVVFTTATKDNGQFIANVRCAGRLWIFDIETEYSEPRYVVVQVKYGGAKECRRLAEIPAGRGPRSVSISIP